LPVEKSGCTTAFAAISPTLHIARRCLAGTLPVLDYDQVRAQMLGQEST
jgi:hypothetical protein